MTALACSRPEMRNDHFWGRNLACKGLMCKLQTFYLKHTKNYMTDAEMRCQKSASSLNMFELWMFHLSRASSSTGRYVNLLINIVIGVHPLCGSRNQLGIIYV